MGALVKIAGANVLLMHLTTKFNRKKSGLGKNQMVAKNYVITL